MSPVPLIAFHFYCPFSSSLNALKPINILQVVEYRTKCNIVTVRLEENRTNLCGTHST